MVKNGAISLSMCPGESVYYRIRKKFGVSMVKAFWLMVKSVHSGEGSGPSTISTTRESKFYPPHYRAPATKPKHNPTKVQLGEQMSLLGFLQSMG